MPAAIPIGSSWEVYTHGGRRTTGLDVVAWAAEAARRGAGEILLTSMDRDGTRDGYDLPLLEAVAAAVNIPVIASGGAGNLDHLVEALAPGRADAVLAASIFHFGEYRIADARAHLATRGIPVRQPVRERPARSPVRFDPDGLAPVVVQDAVTGDVLMLAYMNDEALRLTRQTGLAHYWSRSRGRLWRKGETSGNAQAVDEVLVNCERNSLLLKVRQTGAVCHDGYPTCFYRRVEPDDSLTVVRERSFDPADVYGIIDRLLTATRLQFGAYAFLRDNPLERVSGTSERLRSPATKLNGRLAGELRELAGVLDGTHRHTDPSSDLRLEASQVMYWVLLSCLRAGLAWDRLRPDIALTTALPNNADPLHQRLRAEADRWDCDESNDEEVAARAQYTLSLVGEACRSRRVDPLTVVESDLRDLASRPYLQPYFAQTQSQTMVTD